MAERSVRAKRANMQLYAPQEVAAPAQAIQRGMGLLSNSMDRMSQFFNEQARVQAEIEGQQYGARNAPTAEQLQDAFQSGDELELPGGFGTVFDRAARKAALDITQNEVEFEARKRINEIITNATMNGTNPATILDDIDAVTHGFAATFDDSSPGVARKLRAGLSIWANSKMASYENSYIAEQKTKSQSNLLSNMLSRFEGFNKIIADGIPVGKPDPKTGVQPVRALTSEDLINLKLDQIDAARRAGFPPSSLTTIGNLFDKNIIDAANQVLIDSVLIDSETPEHDIKDISNGRVASLEIATQNAVATLRGQGLSFSDIAKQVRDRRIDELKYIEAEAEQADRTSEKLEEVNVAEAMRFIIENNPEKAKTYIDMVRTSDPVRAMDLTTKLLESGGARSVSDPDAIEYLERLQSNISFPNVLEKFNDLNLADRKKYYTLAETYQNDAVKEALLIMKGALSLPANIDDIAEADPDFEKIQIFRRLAGDLASEAGEAKSQNKDIDARLVAVKLLKTVEGDLDDVIQRLVLKTANQVIDNLIGRGFDDLRSGMFSEALSVVSQLIINKTNNPNDMPETVKHIPIFALQKMKKSIMEAMP